MEKIISNEHIMSKEAFNELIDGIEIVGILTDYGRANIKYHVRLLQQENQQLKEELKAVNKGLRKVLSKRKKWKYRYYKEKMKNRKAIKYIEDKIQKSFKADYGLEPFERTDRLFTETVFELQKIEQILDKGTDK